jgi:hypothetical protein
MTKQVSQAASDRITARRQALKTPRAAAFAGIVFAVLFTTCIVLIRLALPEDLSGGDTAAALQANGGMVSLALTLFPFAGIAFLWFVGVIRDRIGKLEDQFFSTVFFGSGLLFLAMMFVSAATAGALLSSYALLARSPVQNDIITFGRATMYTVTNVYAIRMAGVFMISLATIWIRTRVMPRLFVLLTYGLAVLMLLAVNLSVWLLLIFPVWVFVISIYILFVSMRGESVEAEEILGASET